MNEYPTVFTSVGSLDIWPRWVAANTAAEVIGLGGTGVIFALVGEGVGSEPGAWLAIGAAFAVILAGTVIEGSTVGTLQWLVLRRSLPALSWRAWVVATALGALAAWSLGMLPNTIIDLLAEPEVNGAVQPPPEPATDPDPLGAWIYLFTTMLGLAAGSILSLFQWLVLRRHVRRAGWWVPANALAWAAGMALIFCGIDLVMRQEGIAVKVVLTVLTLAAAGALVGAIHGLVLVRLLKLRRQ